MLLIKRPIFTTMLSHLTAVYPEEGCGLLAGQAQQISHLYVTENRLHSQTAYEMNPMQQLQAMLEIEQLGLDTVILYHSHPVGQAYPSETDVAQAYYPEMLHLIVSLETIKAPKTAVFSIQNGQITSVPFEVSHGKTLL